ncbi:hypothetical protein XENOCAPTIV_018924 [Xenoophorus captivus]|uniref:Uncharacterized protein n=1 Tax=Xenoophorus captivus TaxID=1517983 RepID=A0ABV0RJB4_9TELE
MDFLQLLCETRIHHPANTQTAHRFIIYKEKGPNRLRCVFTAELSFKKQQPLFKLRFFFLFDRELSVEVGYSARILKSDKQKVEDPHLLNLMISVFGSGYTSATICFKNRQKSR